MTSDPARPQASAVRAGVARWKMLRSACRRSITASRSTIVRLASIVVTQRRPHSANCWTDTASSVRGVRNSNAAVSTDDTSSAWKLERTATPGWAQPGPASSRTIRVRADLIRGGTDALRLSAPGCCQRVRGGPGRPSGTAGRRLRGWPRRAGPRRPVPGGRSCGSGGPRATGSLPHTTRNRRATPTSGSGRLRRTRPASRTGRSAARRRCGPRRSRPTLSAM